MKKNMKNFEQMDIKVLILKMSLPAMISMIVQALYNIVDSIFVSGISEKALTALSLAFPIQLIIVSIFVGLGIGVNSYMSRKWGEKNADDAMNTAKHGFFIGLILWVILAISAFFVPKIFLRLFTDDPIIYDYAVRYTTIVMLFSFGSIFGEVCMNILRSTGDMISSMKVQLVGAITNIILDPILIFGLFFFPRMEVTGAALATGIGQCVSMVLAIYFVLRKKSGLNLHLEKFHFSPKITGEILKVGIPVMFMQMLGSIMISGINFILSKFSDTSIAVFGAYFKLQSLIYMPVFGLTQGLMPILGFNFGAKEKERVTKTIKYGILYATLILLIGAATLQIFPKQLMDLFNSSAEMKQTGILCLRIISLGFLFSGTAIVLMTVFQAFGQAHLSLITSFARQIVVLLPAAYLLARGIGLPGVWLAFPISEVTTFILSLFLAKQIYKKFNNPQGEFAIQSA